MSPETAERDRGMSTMVFPIAEAVAFALSSGLGSSRPVASGTLLLFAALLLCFSVHISIHEVVHHPRLGEFPLAGPLLSIVIGLPFQGYRWHHFNHHRWNNRIEDYSSTWRQTPSGPRPWPLWRYVAGWPRQLVRSGLAMRMAAKAGHIPPSTHRAIRREQWTLFGVVLALTALAPIAALRYVTLVYVGWALVSLQNYGQHPPRQYGADVPTSKTSRLYNRLLFRNGLHAEHHEQPQLPWHAIEAHTHEPIAVPHLLQAFLEPRHR